MIKIDELIKQSKSLQEQQIEIEKALEEKIGAAVSIRYWKEADSYSFHTFSPVHVERMADLLGLKNDMKFEEFGDDLFTFRATITGEYANANVEVSCLLTGRKYEMERAKNEFV